MIRDTKEKEAAFVIRDSKEKEAAFVIRNSKEKADMNRIRLLFRITNYESRITTYDSQITIDRTSPGA